MTDTYDLKAPLNKPTFTELLGIPDEAENTDRSTVNTNPATMVDNDTVVYNVVENIKGSPLTSIIIPTDVYPVISQNDNIDWVGVSSELITVAAYKHTIELYRETKFLLSEYQNTLHSPEQIIPDKVYVYEDIKPYPQRILIDNITWTIDSVIEICKTLKATDLERADYIQSQISLLNSIVGYPNTPSSLCSNINLNIHTAIKIHANQTKSMCDSILKLKETIEKYRLE